MYTFKFTYRVRKYPPPALFPQRRKGDKPDATIRLTSVEIFKDSVAGPIAKGISRQSSRDQDIKAMGRKIAIRNALREYDGISKLERTRIWDDYFNAP